MAFRGLPAISSRVRYSKSNVKGGRFSVIASLDVEIGAFSDEDISINYVNMELSEGSAEDLGRGVFPPLLPLTCRPKDNPTFLFSLTPDGPDLDANGQSSAKTVLVTVHATVLVSKTCRPNIEMRWKTGVDFSTALNPLYGAPGPSMQRPNRPSSLQKTSSTVQGDSLPASARGRPSSSEAAGSVDQRQRVGSVTKFGISINFTAPKSVYVGKLFSWDVLVLNRSTEPRQLALIIIPKRRKGFTGTHSSKSSSSSVKVRKDREFADAVIDENVLYAMQRNTGHDAIQVISMSTDVRVG